MALLRNKAARNKIRTELYEAVDSDNISLRDAVRTIRRISGLSRTDYAAKVGVAERTLKEFEQGRGNPTIETVNKMLRGSGLELGVRRVKGAFGKDGHLA